MVRWLPPISNPATWVDERVVVEAESILQGRYVLFSNRTHDLGNTPDWHRNVATGQIAPRGLHWTSVGDFSHGDIKWIWEMSRFPWAYALTRAQAQTGDERFAQAFWRLFESWLTDNPPNTGVNWVCGQEASFRLFSVVFACEQCGVPEAHRQQVARFVVAIGRRVAANLDYALSQDNNHGISECVGLITAALLIPEHSESATWLKTGLIALQSQLCELVYADGGFSQHSLVYHRVLIHDLCWCRSRLVGADQAVPFWLNEAGSRATEFLATITHPNSGAAPVYGSNDGANVLPLASTQFLDMRPTVIAGKAAFQQVRIEAPPMQQELARWLVPTFDTLPPTSWPDPQPVWLADNAGSVQLIQGHGRLFMRCPRRFRHRPAQADMLHVDVSWERHRITLDPGSFSYNSAERYGPAFKSAANHNVVVFGSVEPLRKVSRFLYLPWPTGQVSIKEDHFSASNQGYSNQGIRWNRTVAAAGENGFTIHDQATISEPLPVYIHWLLSDYDWELDDDQSGVSAVIEGECFEIRWTTARPQQSVTLTRADEHSALGWWSPYYGAVEPAVSLRVHLGTTQHIDVATRFSPRKQMHWKKGLSTDLHRN